MDFLHKLESFFLKFDFFGRKVEFYLGNKTAVRSRVGAFVSLVIIIAAIMALSNNFNGWINNENLQIISSSHSFNTQTLLLNNQSFSYEFNHKNFYIQFMAAAQIENGSIIPLEKLDRYFSQYFLFWDEQGVNYIEYENCQNNKTNEFLMIDGTTESRASEWKYCLKYENPLNMGLFPNISKQLIFNPNLIYAIFQCKNSTSNNNSCATLDEIENMSNNIVININTPNSMYDFKNNENPRKHTYELKSYHLDFRMTKIYEGRMKPIYLYTDKGILNEDFHLDSVDYNVDSVDYEANIRDSNKSPLLFEFYLNFGMKKDIYYRRNEKFTNILAKIGGILNISFIFGKIICSAYNLIVLKHKLINVSFSNLDQKFTKKGKNNKNFNFSFFSMLCAKIKKNSVYSKGLKNLYEYMDIQNIIKRLQDIDKMKFILFDPKQRKVFEALPKPGIFSGHGNVPAQTSYFTMDDVLKSKIIKTKRESESFSHECKFLLNGDPLNKRMFDLLDKEQKERILKNNVKHKEDTSLISPQFQSIFIKKDKSLNFIENSNFFFKIY